MDPLLAVYIAGVVLGLVVFGAVVEIEEIEDSFGGIVIIFGWPLALICAAAILVVYAPIWVGRKLGDFLEKRSLVP